MPYIKRFDMRKAEARKVKRKEARWLRCENKKLVIRVRKRNEYLKAERMQVHKSARRSSLAS